MGRFKPTSRLLRFIAASLLLGALCWPLGPLAPAAAEEAPLLVIIHTGDVHGQALERREAASGRLSNHGYARLKGYFQKVPAQNKLLLDAGDVLHGQPLATARRGEFIALILQALNYDALAVGNHDLDYGLPRLMELRDGFGLNFLAANIIEKEDGMPLLPPWLVKDFEGLRVGIFALTTPETPLKTDPANVRSVSFGRPGEVLELGRLMTEKLRREEGAELVIALTHLGNGSPPQARDLARIAPGLNLIIDGHSHQQLALFIPNSHQNPPDETAPPDETTPESGTTPQGETLLVSAGAFLENLGQVTVHRSAGGGLSLVPRLLSAEEMEATEPDPEIKALLERINAELDRELSRVLGRTPLDLNGQPDDIRQGSTNLGRLVCAALRSATGADAAIINSGSIRASLPAGDITGRQLAEVLPYPNYAVTVRLSGARLLEALNNGLARTGQGGFPQFHGLNVTARELSGLLSPPSFQPVRAESVEINGRPLDPAAEYSLAVNDFMAAGGDGYAALAGLPVREYATVMEIFQNFLAGAGPETLQAIDRDDPLTIIVEE